MAQHSPQKQVRANPEMEDPPEKTASDVTLHCGIKLLSRVVGGDKVSTGGLGIQVVWE